MRQLSTIVLLIFVSFAIAAPAHSEYKGGISYSIPIEYKNLSESELKANAEKYFNQSTDIKDGIISPETTNALNLYSVLMHINPTEIIYPVRLGILYDKINRDRYAKGCFSHALGLDSSRYEPYFYFGEFYYKREMYRKALNYYKKASECANASAEVGKRLSELNKKLGAGSTVGKGASQNQTSRTPSKEQGYGLHFFDDDYTQSRQENNQQWDKQYSDYESRDFEDNIYPYDNYEDPSYNEFHENNSYQRPNGNQYSNYDYDNGDSYPDNMNDRSDSNGGQGNDAGVFDKYF